MMTLPGKSIALLLCSGLLSACSRVPEQNASLPAKPAGTLVLSAPVDHLDGLAREPMVVQHPNGTLFLTGYGRPEPHLWQSTDEGATWSQVNVGTEAGGAVGNSDVDLAMAADGTLYFVVMSYDRAKEEGLRIAIGTSRDAGASWSWSRLSDARYSDRPWVEVTPNGTAHVIWNDGGGVAYAVSRDRGATWQQQPRIHPQGHSSHLAIAPNGDIAVRITPVSASGNIHHAGVDLIAVSSDGGANWTKHPAPGVRSWTFPYPEGEDPMPRWVEPLAWDADGSLYYLWTDPAGLWLAGSTNRGVDWTTWQLAQGGELRYFPYLIARRPGELAATWFSGRGEETKVHVATIDIVQRDFPPRVAEGPPFSPDTWELRQKRDEPRRRDTAGEYVPFLFLRDGRLAVVTTIQDDQAKRFGFSWRTVAGSK